MIEKQLRICYNRIKVYIMKKILLDLFKGFLIGFDCTIPGFSIATLAILLNVYERIISDLNIFLKHPWEVIKRNFFLALGFAIGFVIDILVITYLLTHFPLQTVMFFVGMVFATIPKTFKIARGDKIKVRDVIICIVSFAILVVISLIQGGSSKEVELKFVFIMMIFLMGVFGAGSMVIPGISGSLIIMAFGYYEPIMVTMKEVIAKIASFSFSGIGTYLIVVLVFIVGIILGVLVVAKIIDYLINKVKTSVYSGILGLLLASPFAIIYLTIKDYNDYINFSSPWVYIVGAITLVLGAAFGFVMTYLENKNKPEESQSNNSNVDTDNNLEKTE